MGEEECDNDTLVHIAMCVSVCVESRGGPECRTLSGEGGSGVAIVQVALPQTLGRGLSTAWRSSTEVLAGPHTIYGQPGGAAGPLGWSAMPAPHSLTTLLNVNSAVTQSLLPTANCLLLDRCPP